MSLRVRVPQLVTRAAPVGRAAPLSSTRRFDPESPNRWLVRALIGNTGLCGSERGKLQDVRRSASNGEDGWARRLLGCASRAEARRRAEASQRHPFLREPPVAPGLDGASGGGADGAQAIRTASRAPDEDDRCASSGNQGARSATTCPRSAEGRDLQCLRSPLLRPGAQGGVVRVAPLDERTERAVPRPFPDGFERAAAVRARADGAPAGNRCTPVLRGVRPGLEPVELQALVPVFVGARTSVSVQTAGRASGRAFLFRRPSGRCPE